MEMVSRPVSPSDVRDAPGPLQALIEFFVGAENVDVAPVFLAHPGDLIQRLLDQRLEQVAILCNQRF